MKRESTPALEERVVRALIASGLIRRRRWPRIWMTAAAVTLAAAVAVSGLHLGRGKTPGETYVMLLYEDSTFQLPAPGHLAERRAEYARWADSLAQRGELDLGGVVAGSGPITGMFIIRARTDADAARLAASCPHRKYGGHIEVRRFVE
jgi:hypothetical protein